ncbi:hypothetical protein [Mycolicibacterium houstonense]|uniref:hypothetical protein n=1 Tax=Mycolicibacterium houstonense TaxID=146021 RepID=UPI00135A0F89|nr:hypothetical protein [Mycolicibacterium houstonense]
MQGDTLAVEFVARGDIPTTKEEWLGILVAVVMVWTTVKLVGFWVDRRESSQLDAEEARLTAESAQFRSRWPVQWLWQVPYAELEAEAERCWRIVFVLEKRRGRAREGQDVGLAAQIAAVRAWISTVVNAMNAVARR